MPRVRKQLSILVPMGGTDPVRRQAWEWLHLYWRYHLPEAEIVIGHDERSTKRWWRPNPQAFSKAEAVNNAFRRSHGDVIVILDSDAYLDPHTLTHWAKRFRLQRKLGIRSWAVPYANLYRHTENATERLLRSSPRHPKHFTDPPPFQDIEGTDGSGWASNFGAMCMMMPREAFTFVGGFDPRMRGWGSEDRAMVLVLDTLWGRHRTSPGMILHLHHPKFRHGAWEDSNTGKDYEVRIWENQDSPKANRILAMQYDSAKNDPERMRVIIRNSRRKHKHSRKKDS